MTERSAAEMLRPSATAHSQPSSLLTVKTRGCTASRAKIDTKFPSWRFDGQIRSLPVVVVPVAGCSFRTCTDGLAAAAPAASESNGGGLRLLASIYSQHWAAKG